MKPARLIILCAAALAATLVTSAQQKAPTKPSEIPIEAFFAAPDISDLQISPDGKYASFLAVLGTGHVGIALIHLDTGKMEPFVGPRDENVKFYFWKGDDWIVYGGDIGGNESASLRSINVSKRRVEALAESFRERYADRANVASVLGELPDDPNEILIWGNKDIGSHSYGIWTLNITNGRRWLVEGSKPTRDRESILAAGKGVIYARTLDDGDTTHFRVRGDAKSSFIEVATMPSEETHWSFERLSGDGSTLYLFTKDGTELRTIDTATGKLSDPLFTVENGALGNVMLSEDRNTLYGVSYEDKRQHYHWFDKGREALQAQIDASLPKTENVLVSRSHDEKLLAVYAYSDVDPGTYYILDLRVPRLMKIGQVHPRIDPKLMRPMEPIHFKARDGLVIHGYLTRPAAHADTPGPMIVNPHGGPFGIRDSWGYNPEVQFLASRGYAVLQINYRGSGGYGQEFMEAGKKQWGGKMQDDLTDGVKWAIENKIADPDRIAIYGASYGGYAALAGVTFTPDLYKCAINYVGASDLKILNRWGTFGSNATEKYLKEWVGTDPEYVRTRSPVNYVENIKVPILNAYGFNDPRIDIDHWKRLRAKLVEYNKPFEEMIAPEEGHGFYDEKTRLEFYSRMSAFLAKNLPADN